jgi:hypothetical protein
VPGPVRQSSWFFSSLSIESLLTSSDSYDLWIELRSAIGLGLTVDELREWAPFHPLEIYWARKNRLPLAEARRWAREGVPIRDAIKAREVRLSFAELRHWQDAGFNPADAWEAKETGVTIPQAAAWREAGFVLPDALQLIRDGWDLEQATVARYDGIKPYGA